MSNDEALRQATAQLAEMTRQRDALARMVETIPETHMQFGFLRPDGTEEMMPCADWCYRCKLDRAEAERDRLAAGLPLICSDDRHRARVRGLEAQLAELRAGAEVKSCGHPRTVADEPDCDHRNPKRLGHRLGDFALMCACGAQVFPGIFPLAGRPLAKGNYPKLAGAATVASDQCPRCRGDNDEPWADCQACAGQSRTAADNPVSSGDAADKPEETL